MLTGDAWEGKRKVLESTLPGQSEQGHPSTWLPSTGGTGLLHAVRALSPALAPEQGTQTDGKLKGGTRRMVVKTAVRWLCGPHWGSSSPGPKAGGLRLPCRDWGLSSMCFSLEIPTTSMLPNEHSLLESYKIQSEAKISIVILPWHTFCSIFMV